ncbi:uncharacterized protein LOC105685330 isoform X3 [Athalia rosae]|uniref:uncharacterized protein LOC105685330 isoform X3 n=1 Tax=Athalia rosae TaxID=37344 RepID=UPI0006252228|nr:uncharacterized protein LOC105685330 isoform X3 [Athalia rosae]
MFGSGCGSHENTFGDRPRCCCQNDRPSCGCGGGGCGSGRCGKGSNQVKPPPSPHNGKTQSPPAT